MQCIKQKELWVDGHGFILVPCNKCIPCLMNKRNDWSFRLGQEHRVSKSAYFITLTYDEKHLRTDRSLNKRDLQLYLKRLRKKHDRQTRIRYYAVGEYGTRSGRPHYHILLFNSLEEHIRSAWVDCKGKAIGLVHIGNVTEASIAYCTKYIIQKDTYPEGMEKPFATMSRSYGIGAHYLSDAMVSWHREDDRNYAVVQGQKCRLPRFYKEKIFWKDEDKKRVGAASLALVLENERKEKEYYALMYGLAGEAKRLDARDKMLSRVKQKIAYTQTI